jgi:hypothetical protein
LWIVNREQASSRGTRRTHRTGRSLSAITSVDSGSWLLGSGQAGDPLLDGDYLETRMNDLPIYLRQLPLNLPASFLQPCQRRFLNGCAHGNLHPLPG